MGNNIKLIILLIPVVLLSCQPQKNLRKLSNIWQVESFIFDGKEAMVNRFKYFELEFCHSKIENHFELIISDESDLPEFAHATFSIDKKGKNLIINFFDNPDSNMYLNINFVGQKLELRGTFDNQDIYIRAKKMNGQIPKEKHNLQM